MLRNTLILGSVFALALAATAAGARAEGVLSAQALRPIPPGATISVEPLDNSRENLRIQEQFESLLTQRGFKVERGGQLILTFETRDDLGEWNSAERRALVDAQMRGGRTGGEDARVRASIFDSRRGGVLNKGDIQTQPSSTPSQYKLEVTLDDRSNGRRLWQGWSSADLGPTQDGSALISSMVGPMVESLGKTVKSRPIGTP
ncbi:MAG: hypothetical protein H6907_03560 [Hyphomicrobiales bacterium]|nr:hypothetical protein [Hyphomicrobiales bacterium]MCP5370786.1 hypothetical protein [Hyphomicrobiales bacterium]